MNSTNRHLTKYILRPLAWSVEVTIAFFLTGTAAAAPLDFANAIGGDGPVLYYRLSEVAGNAINNGSFGPTHDGEFNGNITRDLATSAGDSGVRFTGVNDFIESLTAAPVSLTGNPDFTGETLIRIPSNATSAGYAPFILWGSNGTGNSVYFSLRRNENRRVYTGFYNAGLMMSDQVCFDTWLHVVFVRDSGGGLNDSETGTTLYINGIQIAQERDLLLNPGFDADLTITSSNFRINRGYDFSRFSTIEMDEIALYDRVLESAEVAEHWAAFADNTGDNDGDGVADANDNCVAVSNANQRDTNGDGFGNICDSDLNNDGVVNFLDLGQMKAVFFTSDPDADLNGDGSVNFLDLGIMKGNFFGMPGPSGTIFICN